ncbi:glycoside hydrolase family 79 protein [Diplodia corticola]|uniref:Glycoside hydrolase family 79 protein n=1 Tax=Diplodia corticola TaxID=236234 RepID=A0A1J9QP77_9PEZI|nr:glycoside hydrolase family 79 protein [Diplodia corticola]OJD30256.1 glycoside hydrolase family 79 protein [Diplodia corticola]
MKPTTDLAILCAAAVTATAAPAPNSSSDSASTIQWSLNPSASDATAVDKGYIGFGIEMTSFPDYAGVGSTPNRLSTYLFSQISTRTGGAPLHIRVGGTSMDNTVWRPALTSLAVNTTSNAQCALHADVDIGKPWLDGFANLAGADGLAPRWTVQIPLARKNVSNGVAFAEACIDALGGTTDTLDGFEIGNEPNFYPTIGCGSRTDRNSSWGPQDYAREWTAYAADLTSRVGPLKQSGVKDWFQTLTLASGVKNKTLWGLSGLWDKLNDGGYVKTVSQHYYQTTASGTLKDDLLNHAGTVSEIQSKFGDNIAFAAKHNVPFILGEVGSAIVVDSSAGVNQALYDTLGASLWTLDFLLHGMTLGIERVSMQLGTNFRMSAWQPISTTGHPKAVHGNYYGLVAGAEFVGGDGDLAVRALELDGHPNVVGYAGYHGGKLSKVAVLNLNVWNNGTGAARGEKEVALTGLGDDVTSVRVSRLTAPGGAAANSSITWAGKRWTAENNGTEYTDGETPVTINVEGGAPKRSVVVKASEAVVVELLRG